MFGVACFFSVQTQSIHLKLFDFVCSALKKKQPVTWNLSVCNLINRSSSIGKIFKFKW